MTQFQLPPTITNFVRANQTNILMSAGIGGAVATAALSWRGGMRTARILDAHPKATTRRERFGLIWKELLLPAGASVLTVASIVGLDKAHTKKIASVAAAYALSERALSDLKKETAEVVGEKKAQEITDKVAQEAVTKDPPKLGEIVTVNERQTLACELYTRRYFWTNVELIRRAELRVNQALTNGEYVVSMAEFYDDLELSAHPAFAHDFGWVCNKPLRIEYTSVLTPEGQPCLAFSYNYVTNLEDERTRR